MLKERKRKGCGGSAGGWEEGERRRWAVHLDRKHRGEEQELEVSLTERKEVVVVARRGGVAAEVPSPLLTEPGVVSGGGVREEGDRDRDQGKIKGVCRGRKRGGRRGWVRGAEGVRDLVHLDTCSHRST